MEPLMTEKESIDLIQQMINTAKNNLQKGMGNIFLLWGYLVTGISLIIFILLLTLESEIRYDAYFLWFLMAFGYPFHVWLFKKMESERTVKTYIEKIMGWVWIAFTISILTLIIGLLIASCIVLPRYVIVEQGNEFLRWFQWLFITPFMLCLYGFALFVSGKAYGFRPLVTGGYICWVGTFILLFSIHQIHVLEIQQIIMCLSTIFGFVIPGHLLNLKDRTHV